MAKKNKEPKPIEKCWYKKSDIHRLKDQCWQDGYQHGMTEAVAEMSRRLEDMNLMPHAQEY